MTRHVLYPGTFDPVTLGHLDILERAGNVFDKVTVVVAESDKGCYLNITERVDLYRQSVAHLDNVDVHSFSGLLVDEVRLRSAAAVVRGIRSSQDYDYEWGLAGVNALLSADVEYIYFLARPDVAAISSTLVRDVIKHGGDLSQLVPPAVAAALRERS
jgi:pantetheine-phosphate adenylyltransferase